MAEPRFILHLAPSPAGEDKFGRVPATRLKLALKILGRQLGLRCVKIESPPSVSSRDVGLIKTGNHRE